MMKSIIYLAALTFLVTSINACSFFANDQVNILETKIYVIGPKFENKLLKIPKNGMKAYYIKQGIHFPAGSMIVYDKEIKRLIVTNTQENLTELDKLLSGWDSDYMTVQIGPVEVSPEDIKELTKQN